jgi:ubiquinone biosynthesis monooxygenase Coq7
MMLDTLIFHFDHALRALAVVSSPASSPDAAVDEAALDRVGRKHAAALMRVNHSGEICAQALYHGQAATAQSGKIRLHMQKAAAEEGAHLAWTAARVKALGGHTSLLNPLWYAGSFALGACAARLGDPLSLGFVAETERQVERHLDDHLARLPAADRKSRVVLEAMREDEIRHGGEALQAGGTQLPLPARLAMKAAGKVMTSAAYWI